MNYSYMDPQNYELTPEIKSGCRARFTHHSAAHPAPTLTIKPSGMLDMPIPGGFLLGAALRPRRRSNVRPRGVMRAMMTDD